MRKKFKITFEVDCNYPHIDNAVPIRSSTKMIKDFEQWLKDWTNSSGKDIMPILYEPARGKTGSKGDWEHAPNGTVKVKIVRDKETILDTWWDVLSDDF